MFLFIFSAVCIYLPSSSRVATRFDLQPFTTTADDGTVTSYYSYKFWLGAGIALNSVLTYFSEKLIINVLTKKSDSNLKVKKEATFHTLMNEYRAQVKD